MTRSLGVSESLVHTLSLAHGGVGCDDVLSRELLGGLIGDSLELLVFHLAGDGLAGVIRHVSVLVLEELLLDLLNVVVDSVTVKHRLGIFLNSNYLLSAC